MNPFSSDVFCSSAGLPCCSKTRRKITDHLKPIISNCFCEGLMNFRASFIRFWHIFLFLKYISPGFSLVWTMLLPIFLHAKCICILAYYYHTSAFICHGLFLHYLMTAISFVSFYFLMLLSKSFNCPLCPIIVEADFIFQPFWFCYLQADTISLFSSTPMSFWLFSCSLLISRSLCVCE